MLLNRQKTAKNVAAPRASNNLLQVAGFLKLADKLVRERSYSLALEQIAKARAKDPTNSYAEAYEQRVQLLLNALGAKTQASARSLVLDSETPQSFTQHLGNIASLAIQEAQRTATVALDQNPRGQQKDRENSPPFELRQSNEGEKQTAGSPENQVRRYLRLSEDLLQEQKLDEALNTLLPAILLDPLNVEILQLEERIREAQHQKREGRLRQTRVDNRHPEQFRGLNEKEIQKCILRALELTQRKEYSEALTVIGKGYLQDPFNASLASCEKYVLTSIANDSPKLASQDSGPALDSAHQPGEESQKRGITQILDQALSCLDEDRFVEAITHVNRAIIALQDEKDSSQEKRDPARRFESLYFTSGESGLNEEAPGQAGTTISRQVFVHGDKAKQLAGRGEFEAALNELLHAFYLIPTDGSLKELHFEIARSFMEYYRLMKAEEKVRRATTQVEPDSTVSDTSVGPDRMPRTQTDLVPHSGIIDDHESVGSEPERQLEFEMSHADVVEDGVSEIKEHILRSLRHLKSMRLVEAAIEAEIAGQVDCSRIDIGTFVEAIAGLARKAKNGVPLGALTDMHRSVLQQAKNIVYSLSYEEMLNGIERVLDTVPSSEGLMELKSEIERSFHAFTQSISSDAGYSATAPNPLRKIRTIPKRMKKRSLDQMGLEFSDDVESADNSIGEETQDRLGSEEALAAQKPFRGGLSSSSGQVYVGN